MTSKIVVNNIEPDAGISTVSILGIATATKFIGDVEGGVTGNVTGSSGSCTGNAATATVASGITTTASVNTSGIVTATSFVGSTPLSHRNVIINGAAMVAQRGDTTSGATTGGYATDRFQAVQNETGTITISQDSDAPSGFRKCHRLTQTTAQGSLDANDLTTFRYNAEGYDVQRFKKGTSDAEQFTVSFWVKSVDQSSYPVTYILELRDPVNTRSCCKAYTVTASNTWEYKTITFPADTTGQWATDTSKALEMNWFVAAGSNYTTGTLSTTWAGTVTANRAAGLTANLSANTANRFFLTGVQLEVGPVATPFEHRSFGDELRRCQRYYQRWKGHSDHNGIGVGRGNGSSGVFVSVNLVQCLRATPSITNSGIVVFKAGSSSTSTTDTPSLTSASAYDATSCMFPMSITGLSGITNNYGGYTVFLSSSDLQLDAEF